MIEMRRILLFLSLLPLFAQAQFNTDRLVMIGRSALYYEDYVLSIQYFNQAISQKPWLYEPWFFRGVAKFYLDDFRGAEIDCSEAIERNPYVVSAYELRGLSRINQKKFAEAVSDYDRALRYDPENQGLWHNRILCLIQEKDYDRALAQIDTMTTRWSRYARAYAMEAEIYLLQKDTTKAVKSLDKSLELDPYDGGLWAERAIISLARQKWKEGEELLTKSIHLLPKHSDNYINRAMARYNQNNLRGAMSDYDTALDLDPDNFLGHYNRGLLRAQVGDDNRGIEDFNFVLKLEPDNLMALFNRALLLEQTGNLRGAVRDYSKVIEEYPNFWFGLQHRASCYRRLGNTKQAELDEFRILKAQMDKRYGKQPRLSKKQMRKRSDEDLEKYNQLVVADEQEVEHEYKSDYRGRVQNRKAELVWQPMYGLTFIKPQNDVKIEIPYESTVDQFNQRSGSHTVFVSCEQRNLSEERMKQTFSYIDSLSTRIDEAKTTTAVVPLLLLRAVAYGTIQNFDNAIDDLSICLQIDSTSSLAYWQRAVCQAKINEFNASQGTNIELKSANVMGDLSEAIQQSPKNAYLYYNRGNLYAQRNDYQHAIDDYTRALKLEERLAEAWFNRGLAKIYVKRVNEGIEDLSKAGELGLYQAYSVIKKYREK
ncbi:Tetratricopeptide repeat-containing protein [Xylanibacter ruminicola]|uniref:Tetratricopeptide repeat-containing protein n=2 Tax=Bacteroidales TaxID=171549 RepID=A0A1H5WI96_XYLRU|nr:Tetratricopeptide repeat-containing protein [Xylanibacter ruminicola]